MAAKRNSPRDKDVSVEPYKSLFESNPHPMWVYDLDTLAFLAVNDTAVRKYGFSRRKFLRMTIADIRPSEDTSKLKQNISRVTDGLDEAGTWRHRKNNGSIIDVEISSHTILWNGRRAELVMAQDVTERKRAQSKIHHLTRLYAVLSQINQAIVRTKNRDDLFASICNVCVKFGQFRMAWIGLIDESTGSVNPIAHAGYEKGYLKKLAISTRKQTRAQGSIGTALQEGSLVTSMDISADPLMRPWRTEALKRGYRSSAAVPFRENNKVVGSLSLYASEPRFFSEDEKQLLEEIGANVSFALDAIRVEEQRARAEDALRVSLAKYKTLFDSFPLGITVADGAGKIYETNRIAERLLGISRAEHLRRKIRGKEWRIIRPDGTPMPAEEYASVRALKENRLVENVEMGIVKAPDDVTWISVNAAPLPLDEHGVVVTYGDITERKRAEETRTEMSRLLEESLNEIYVFDADTLRFVHVNRGARNNLGYTTDELHLLTPVDLKPEFNLQRFRKLISPLQTGEREKIIFETKHRRKNNTLYDVEVHLQKGMFEGRPVFVAIIIDITERKRVEDALKRSELFTRSIVENEPECVKVFERDGKLRYINPTGLAMIEMDNLEMVQGQFVDPIVLPEYRQAFMDLITKASHGGRGTIQFEIMGMKGTKRWLDTHAVPIQDEHGKVESVLGLTRDITERKRTEEALRALSTRHQAILASVPEIITEVNQEKVYTWTNPAGVTFFGEDVIGKEAAYYFEGEQGTYEQVNPLFDGTEDAVYVESWQRRKDGEKRLLAWWCRALKDREGNITGALSTARDITDRKRAEVALRISEQKYRDIVTYAPVGIFESTRDGKFLSANFQLANMLGYDSVEELMQRDMATDIYWNPDEREKLILIYEPLGSANNLEVQWKKKDGTPLWVNLSSHVVKDTAGKILWFEGFAHDISERWLSEQALGSAYQQLEATLNALPDLMYEVDRDGRVLSYRAPDNDNLSLAPDVLLGHPLAEVVPRHAGEVFSKALAEAAATGRHSGGTYALDLASGTRWYELSISRMEKQEAKSFRFIVLVRDITERRRAEAALRDSEQRFRTTLYSIGDGVITTDTTGTVRQMNRVAESLTGWSEQDACGQPIQQIFRIVDEETGRPVESPVSQVLRKGVIAGLTGQTVLVAKGGTRRPISDSGAPIKTPAGETTGVVLVFNDQTERRDLQAQLLQAQKMEAIGRLAGGVAHDFNNMIGVILGYAKLIENRLNPLDPLQKNIRAIAGAAERSANLTKQLLAFARKQVIEPIPLNLNDSLSMLHKMLMRLVGEDITLTLVPGANLWNTKIDPTQVDQILANLSTNARDAIDDVGTITIETANTRIDQPLSKEQQDFVPGEYVMLAFSDTGTGMDKATQQRIFEPFFTTKPRGQGTGLGLATVFGIVKQNNGFIHVYSEPGKGSTFKIYLPRFHGEANTPVQETNDVPLGGTETILIVEDEEQLLELSCAALEMHGYAVLSAKSPGEAIILCERTDKKIELLITDVVMPGMNGKELKDRLYTLKPGMKTIFMSGYTADVVAHRGILDEGVFFLQKPFTPLTLAKKVREVLNG